MAIKAGGDARAQEDGRAEIYLVGTPPGDDCRGPNSVSRLSGCAMQIGSDDPKIRIIRMVIQYPSPENDDGSRNFSESLGSIKLSLADKTPYLVRRAKFLHGEKVALPSLGALPVVVTVYYQYEGRKYFRSSAYNILYWIGVVDGESLVVPTQMDYCGKIDRPAEFLVDPWMPSIVGYNGNNSSALLFECMNSVVNFDIKNGRYKIVTGMASEVHAKGGVPALNIPISVKGFQALPVDDGASIVQSRRALN